MHVYWIAMTLAGIHLYDTPQKACAEADKAGTIRVYRLTYRMDSEAYCCENKFETPAWQNTCKNDPDMFNCEDQDPQTFPMDCITSPSFTVVDAVEAKK